MKRCPLCGRESDGYFCTYCGKRLVDYCDPCWVKKKPYKCGFERCPGLRLIAFENLKKRFQNVFKLSW